MQRLSGFFENPDRTNILRFLVRSEVSSVRSVRIFFIFMEIWNEPFIFSIFRNFGPYHVPYRKKNFFVPKSVPRTVQWSAKHWPFLVCPKFLGRSMFRRLLYQVRVRTKIRTTYRTEINPYRKSVPRTGPLNLGPKIRTTYQIPYRFGFLVRYGRPQLEPVFICGI